MEADGEPQIGGASAAAILMLLLEEKEAADVLRHLDPDEVRQLGSEMFGAAEADENKVDLALGRFVSGSREVSALTPGANRKIRNVMTDALGDDRAGSLLSSIAPQPQRDALERLRWMETETIADVIDAEHPQVGAVLLSMLAPDIAAAVLAGFSGERQADLLWRAARLGPVHAEAATLALALKGAGGALADRFLATMSARAAETIRDELAEMAHPPSSQCHSSCCSLCSLMAGR